MKRILFVATLLVLATGFSFAGGDKVRGDKGQGDVNQNQINDPPPFEGDDLGALFFWLFE